MTDRYKRHLPLLTEAAWSRLRSTAVLVAGVGGLGSHVLQSIARLGPLTIEFWDPGVLNEPDLNRQILYSEADLHRPKVEAAGEILRRINSELILRPVGKRLTATAFEAESSLRGGQFVIFDCLDTFAARAELDTIHRESGAPLFHGGAEGWYGQATTFLARNEGYAKVFGPEYAEIPAAAKPILPQTVSAVASFEVAEYLHWCESPEETPLSSAMLMYDGRSMRVDRVELS